MAAPATAIAQEALFRKLPSTERLECIFVLGGPGSGKGTQCSLLHERFGYVHISAGDLLRAERRKGGPLGRLIEDHISEGKIVPSSITVQLLRDAMTSSGQRRFLIDGFPRSEENLAAWEDIMTDVAEVKYLLFLDCPEEVMVQRVLGRAAAGSQRSDDNEAVVRKRLKTYASSTMPIIDFFTREGKTLKIDASLPVEDVFAAIRPHLEPEDAEESEGSREIHSMTRSNEATDSCVEERRS